MGHGESHLPPGSVSLVREPRREVRCDFYSGREKRSLLPVYGDEVAHATQTLMDREYVIALFRRCAQGRVRERWNHSLSFSGAHVTERSARLRAGTPIYERIVGPDVPPIPRVVPRAERTEVTRSSEPGISVSQRGDKSPTVQCLIAYPRTVELTFSSVRLRPGLHAITEKMASLISESNRRVEEQREFGSESEWW